MHFSAKNRWVAFLYHLALSFIIFFVLAYIIAFHWYPDFLFATDGGWQGIRLIAGVDLIIGPFLTLIVYKPNKKGLAFDLSLIAMVQIACLSAGTYTVWHEHPISLVYADGTYYSVTAKGYKGYRIDINDIELLKNRSELTYIYTDLPIDKKKIKALERDLLIQKKLKPFYVQTERYLPYKAHLDKLAYGKLSDEHLKTYTEKLDFSSSTFPDGTGFFPLVTRYSSLTILAVDLNTGKVIDYFSI